MAKNGAKGGGRRGAIRNRTQFELPSGHWAKRHTRTGEIISVKADRTPYKGVLKEKHPPATYVLPGATPQGKVVRVALPPIMARPLWRTRSERRSNQPDTVMASHAMGEV
ncbi:MAG: hypothetical protein M3490_00225 [Chloroflexota bacterium]|nr:hypothetical protein [Chloroflexota bacterium]